MAKERKGISLLPFRGDICDSEGHPQMRQLLFPAEIGGPAFSAENIHLRSGSQGARHRAFVLKLIQ